MVLHVNGSDNHLFVMKGKTKEEPFTAKIDSGSSITIFNQADPRTVLKKDVIFARPMLKTETYGDYIAQLINLVG